MKLLARLSLLIRDLFNLECSRTEAWRRIGRHAASTERRPAPAGKSSLFCLGVVR